MSMVILKKKKLQKTDYILEHSRATSSKSCATSIEDSVLQGRIGKQASEHGAFEYAMDKAKLKCWRSLGASIGFTTEVRPGSYYTKF